MLLPPNKAQHYIGAKLTVREHCAYQVLRRSLQLLLSGWRSLVAGFLLADSTLPWESSSSGHSVLGLTATVCVSLKGIIKTIAKDSTFCLCACLDPRCWLFRVRNV